MVWFVVRRDCFQLMQPSTSADATPSGSWAGMRWRVSACDISQIAQGAYPHADVIDEAAVRRDLDDLGLCLAHAELAWDLARSLNASNLCSPELGALCDVHRHPVGTEILDALQSIYARTALELAQDATWGSNAPEQAAMELQARVRQATAEAFIKPSAELVQLFFLVLSHVHWFAIERFRLVGALPQGLCSIRLGADEFEGIGAQMRYRMPDLSV